MSRLKPKNFFECFQDNSKQKLAALQSLYDSEINFSISTFWDGGFDVKLGSEMSGFSATANFKTFSECIYWLTDEAIKQYPDSKFAAVYAL